MRKPFLVAALILALSATITGQPLNNSKANSKREELPAGTEAAKALARLGILSRSVLRERLRQMRQPAYLPDPVLRNKIIEAQHLPFVSSKRVDQLKAALQPVLVYHQREQMPIIVVDSAQLKAALVNCLVIVITTKLMTIASDTEIRGIIAHELAHEYIWNEYKNARLAGDEKLMRECELFCDAVAAFTLKEIGDDPASYRGILVRLTIIGINVGNGIRREPDTHPALEIREKLNKFLCERLI